MLDTYFPAATTTTAAPPNEVVKDIDYSEYEGVLTAYVAALEHCNAEEILALMDPAINAPLSSIADHTDGYIPSAEDIHEFYKNIYQIFLDEKRSELEEELGDSLAVTYSINSCEIFNQQRIDEANASLLENGADLVIQGVVTLDVTFTVTGSESGRIVNDGFFSSRVGLLKTKGRWTLSKEADFPRPTEDELAEFYHWK